MIRFLGGHLVILRASRPVILETVTDEARIAASPHRRAVAGALLTGALTFATALALARVIGLITPVDVREARTKGLIR